MKGKFSPKTVVEKQFITLDVVWNFEYRRVLLRQHTAALKRKSRQIMEELEQDRQLLESLVQKEAEEVTVRTQRKEQSRADAAWMKQVK